MYHSTWDQTIKRQTGILREELKSLGVKFSMEKAAQLQFLAQRKYDRYDLFSPGETFLSRLMYWLENFDQTHCKHSDYKAFSLTAGIKITPVVELLSETM